MEIGNSLKDLRKEKKLTGIEVAKYLNIVYGSYYKYEANLRRPSIDILEKLRELYNCDYNKLFGFKTENEKYIEKYINVLKLKTKYNNLKKEIIKVKEEIEKDYL